MTASVGLALRDASETIVALESAWSEALAEASTYRQMLSLALESWAADRRLLLGAERRLRQVGGTEAWRPDESE